MNDSIPPSVEQYDIGALIEEMKDLNFQLKELSEGIGWRLDILENRQAIQTIVNRRD